MYKMLWYKSANFNMYIQSAYIVPVKCLYTPSLSFELVSAIKLLTLLYFRSKISSFVLINCLLTNWENIQFKFDYSYNMYM